jgi:AmmeMemoRadiSam system protein B
MIHRQPAALEDIRPPAVAGMFYPGDAAELRRLVESCLEGKPTPACVSAKAYILPHAGYVYSGPVAGTGYRQLRAERDHVRRVVLLGPSHRVAFPGVAVSRYTGFATPLGVVPVDRLAIERLRDLPQVFESDRAHQREHSIEVHLPFLQVALRDFQVVPLVVGDASEREVAEVLDRLWGGPETRIIISSDLSHYHDYASACRLDRETARRIEQLEPVSSEQACGAVPLDGLLHAARARGMILRTLDLRNSGDTAGPRDQVVGYGAFAAV